MSGQRSIGDVVAKQLCVGCGVCAYVAPDRFEMVDEPAVGRRPRSARGDGEPTPPTEAEALEACPGHRLEHTFERRDTSLDQNLLPAWGPVREVWEGHAADPDIRAAGSSGGAITALSLYAIEAAGMHGVLHTRSRPDRPWLNQTVLTTTRQGLLDATGSRYAPASPCDGLAEIESAPGPCVFVGKPCDAAATQSARRLRPALDPKIGLVLAFFCAGTPSSEGNLALLREVGVDDPTSIRSLRYRGNGWPGRWTVRYEAADGKELERSMTYEESWDFLQRYRQWRCYICPDHTGEFADIALGDPWYRRPRPGEPGSSLLVARTQRGVETLHAAADAGYLVLTRRDPTLLPRSQPNLLRTRGRLWGQLLALRFAGAGLPRFAGFPTWQFWRRELTLRGKLSSVVGTLLRVRRKRRRYALGAALRSTRKKLHPDE